MQALASPSILSGPKLIFLSDAPCNSDRGFWMTACGHVLCDKGHEREIICQAAVTRLNRTDKSNTCTFCGKSPISTFVIGGTVSVHLRRVISVNLAEPGDAARLVCVTCFSCCGCCLEAFTSDRVRRAYQGECAVTVPTILKGQFQVHYMESKLKKQKKEIGRLNVRTKL